MTTRSPWASLPLKGLVPKHTTVKWPIHHFTTGWLSKLVLTVIRLTFRTLKSSLGWSNLQR